MISNQQLIVSKQVALQVFNDDGSRQTVLTVSSSNAGSIGIGTSDPQQRLHVSGVSFFDGRVGIGTKTPTEDLDVVGTVKATTFVGTLSGNAGSATTLSVTTGNIGIGILSSSATARLHIYQGADTSDLFRVDDVASGIDTTPFIVNAQGNVGIGTTAPAYPLHVIGTIYASGDISAYSDMRMKTNLEPIPEALKKIEAITGYTFNRKDDPTGKRFAGVVAQEIQEVLPEVVYRNGDTVSVAYGNISALLIEAIKELKREVDFLRSKIT